MPNESLQGAARSIRLVVGLGNPGAEYDGTRHNVGFAVLDHVAADSGVPWQPEAKWHAHFAKIGAAFLLKPMSYMNCSGEPLRAFAQFYKIASDEMLIVYDDMALELGRLRLRLGGGTGGHNGLDSIITTLGTDQIARLRVGIGAAPATLGATDFVLGRFIEEERQVANEGIKRAAEAVKWAIDKGLVSAMNTFNPDPLRGQQIPEA